MVESGLGSFHPCNPTLRRIQGSLHSTTYWGKIHVQSCLSILFCCRSRGFGVFASSSHAIFEFQIVLLCYICGVKDEIEAPPPFPSTSPVLCAARSHHAITSFFFPTIDPSRSKPMLYSLPHCRPCTRWPVLAILYLVVDFFPGRLNDAPLGMIPPIITSKSQSRTSLVLSPPQGQAFTSQALLSRDRRISPSRYVPSLIL